MAGTKPFLFNDPLPVTLAGSVATTLYHNPAVTGLVVAKGSGPSGVYGGFVTNTSTTTSFFLQCFDAATVSAVTLGTTIPQDVIHVPPMSAFGDKWSNTVTYNTGIVIAATTDVNNATIAGTALKVSLYIA